MVCRSPLRFSCISFVFVYDYRRFSHISVHSKRKKNSPTTVLYTACFLWVHEESSETRIMRISTKPSPAAYTEGVTRGRKGKGVGGGGGVGETREGTISLFPFIFFLQTPPLTRPLPNLRLPQRLLTTVPQYTVRFPMLGPEVSMF